MMKKTFEIKGVDLTSLYGVGDKNIIFLEKQLPLQLNVRGNNIFCQGLKKDINHFDSVLNQMIDSIKKGNTLSQKDISQLLVEDPLITKPGVESPLSPIARQGLNVVYKASPVSLMAILPSELMRNASVPIEYIEEL